MKKIFLIIITLISLNAFAAKVSSQQNKLNKEYLTLLDLNIGGTIKLLSSFNTILDSLPDQITGTQLFSGFLMDLTLECGNLKKHIALTETMKSAEREEMIQVLIATLNPDIEYLPYSVSKEQDEQNRQILAAMHIRFKNRLFALQKEILREETLILESGTFNKYFFNLHSQHFMYELLMDFIEPSGNLSRENRNYLIQMATQLEEMMAESLLPTEE